jgi:DNA-binding NarL/FixJ family response regulator
MWLRAVARALRAVDVEVVGEATAPGAALALVEENQPGLLICDPTSKNDNAIVPDFFERVARESPQTKILVLGASREPADIEAALEAGAFAYVFKSADPIDLASAIRQSFEKSLFLRSWLPAVAAASQVRSDGNGSTLSGNGSKVSGNGSSVSGNGSDVSGNGDSKVLGLTRRESEILGLVAEGYSNAQLARMLWVTEQTVKFHLSNIYRKLHVANRTEASRWAQVHGLVSRLPQGA